MRRGGSGSRRSRTNRSGSRTMTFTMTFADQVFKEGWIGAKAQCYSLLRERGPEKARERFCKPLPTDTYLSLNHIAGLMPPANMVVDSKPNRASPCHGCSRMRIGRASKLRCDLQ